MIQQNQAHNYQQAIESAMVQYQVTSQSVRQVAIHLLKKQLQHIKNYQQMQTLAKQAVQIAITNLKQTQCLYSQYCL